MRLAWVMAVVGALLVPPLAKSDQAATTAPPPKNELEVACIRMVTECAAARAAANRDPMVIEHPPGVLFKTTSPAATRHVVNAIAIARGIRQRYGWLPPGCARACDGFLK